MRKIIENKTFGEERALYNLCDADVVCCNFEGEEDGESALKESHGIKVSKCNFLLRYPLWHATDFELSESKMTLTARAALWYAKNGKITECELGGVKCLRECDGISLEKVTAVSPEFGWNCRDIKINECQIESEYFLFGSKNVNISNMTMRGKYSFQYTENVTIENSNLDTKDAFWHAKNVTVKNCEINGEYLGWYSDGLTLIGCKLKGTQPLCYCKNLRLINCTMENTDLSFEYSDVEADIFGDVLSVKNPRSGKITADGFGEIIIGNAVYENTCEIITRK